MRKAASLKTATCAIILGLCAVIATNSHVPSAFATQKLNPTLTCVEVNTDTNEITTYWGYNNPNDAEVTFPVGPHNRFNGSSEDMGQPTVFKPGEHHRVFSTTHDDDTLAWYLDGNFKVATPNSTPCEVDPTPEPTSSPEPTATPEPQQNIPSGDGRSDGLGCSVHDCSGNQVGAPAQGGGNVLSATTLPTTGTFNVLALLPAIIMATTGIALRNSVK